MKKIKFLFLKNHPLFTTFLYRTLISFIGIIFLTIILFVNLYKIQIINFKNYKTQSDKNRIKHILIPPTRGIIYDCNGIPIALNQTIYKLEVIPDQIISSKCTVENLQSLLFIEKKYISNLEKKINFSKKFLPFLIEAPLNEIQQAKFAAYQYKFPGIRLKKFQKRYYPYGSVLAHVVGYISKDTNSFLSQPNKRKSVFNYINNCYLGKIGIERFYENILCGKFGEKIIEVNSHGRIIKEIGVKSSVSGEDIVLTIDADLQRYIGKILKNNRAAVIVANAKNGEILSLISNPSYDPNIFVNGMSKDIYQNFLRNKNFPLINRAIQGIYSPASTVKPYISISALMLGIIDKDFSLFDTGCWKLPKSNKFYRDWKKFGHGFVDIKKALEESVDTFFYHIAYMMGIDQLSSWMKKFGYGQHTGIDIVEENVGIMPTKFWKMMRYKTPWYHGDTISVGIGQGYWSATPIQMMKSLLILINNGSVRVPHLLKYIFRNEKKIFYCQKINTQIGDSDSEFWKIVKDGMYGVANHINGTGYKDLFNTEYKIAAKSGTSQLYNLKNKIYDEKKIPENLRDHKLMIAFAPFKNPKVATIVVLENGGTGLTVGKITKKIFDYFYVKNKL